MPTTNGHRGPVNITMGGGSTISSHRFNPRGGNMWRYLIFGAGVLLLAVGLAFGGRFLLIALDDSPIVTYESLSLPRHLLAPAVYFTPDKAFPGEVVHLHLDRVEWFTVQQKSELVYNITCLMSVEKEDGRRVIEPSRKDYPIYNISTPADVGPVEPKFREIKVPAECLPGRLIHRAFARHHRPWPFSPRITRMPEAILTVVAP